MTENKPSPFATSPLGELIDARLQALDRSKSWLARTMRISTDTVYNWSKGAIPHRSNCLRLIKALQLNDQEAELLARITEKF